MIASLKHSFTLRLPLLTVLVDQALISGTRLLSQIAVAKYGVAEREGIGFYVAAFGGVVLAVMVAESLVTTPLNVFLPQQEPHQRPQFLAGAWTQLLRLTLFMSVLAAGLWWFTSGGTRQLSGGGGAAVSELVGRIAGVLAWYLPAHLVREFGRRWLLALGRNGPLLLADILATLVLCGGVAAAIWQNRLDAPTVFALTTVSNLVFISLWWWSQRGMLRMQSAARVLFQKQAQGYGRWIIAEGLFGVLIVYFSQWLITARMGREASDAYGGCLTLVFIANPFLLGVLSFFSPQAARDFAERGWAGIRASTWRFSVLIGATLAAMAAGVWMTRDWLLVTLFDARYANLGEVVTILSCGMIWLGLGYLWAATLQAIRLPQVNFLASALAGVFVVVFNWFWVQTDLRLAAWSFFGSAALGAAVRWGALQWWGQRWSTHCDTAPPPIGELPTP